MTNDFFRMHILASRGRLAASAMLALAISMLAPTVARAATYYLAPNGSDSNTGLNSSTPWATLSKANSTLRGGDVVVLSNGSYSSFPNPSVDGSANARITYVGNLSNPGLVTVSGGTLTRSYVTLKGLSFSGGVTLGAGSSTVCQRDSIAYSRFESISLYGSKHSMIAANTITNVGGYAVRFLSSNGDQIPTGFANPERDTLRRNTMSITKMGSDSRGIMVTSRSQYCVIDSNVVTGTFNGTADVGRAYLFRYMHAYNNIMKDNSFTVLAENRPGGTQAWAMYCLRDSCYRNLFLRNRFTATGAYPIEFFMSQSGSDQWSNDTKQNVWDGCFWDIRTPDPGGYTGVFWQDGIIADTLRNCVIKSDNHPGLVIDRMRSGNLSTAQQVGLIDHCTFYGKAASNNAPLFLDIQGVDWPTTTTLKITNCIFYTNSTATGAEYTTGLGYYVPRNRSFISNNNLFAHYAGASRSVFYEIEGASSGYSAPGSSGWLCANGTGQGWGQGNECNSRYGSPQFADSSRTSFDPAIRSNSAARGMGTGGSDVGAVPFGAGGPDTAPPDQVTTLQPVDIGDQYVILRWTATGDDGGIGIAAAIDLRWSLSPINSGNFDSATPVASAPVPLASGGVQTYVMLSLTPGTTYYFALKTRDDAGNWSPVSNIANALTLSGDTRAPAGITNLNAAAN
ncbi:MAG: DUF1565 domain-containing protein [Candidatus Eisenbacteria bacterium]|uniref:DUF1565 domain-containing protein n=1 Tax=Eiseniibacteriota bacterium TaxID=2212470 RepID=A0A849SJM9_UNCEI|nr:DUF1565 domain-containing protein [Candidatus Eisenbacteria bacterium]